MLLIKPRPEVDQQYIARASIFEKVGKAVIAVGQIWGIIASLVNLRSPMSGNFLAYSMLLLFSCHLYYINVDYGVNLEVFLNNIATSIQPTSYMNENDIKNLSKKHRKKYTKNHISVTTNDMIFYKTIPYLLSWGLKHFVGMVLVAMR